MQSTKRNVLLIGAGGREHALAWKLAQSPTLNTLYASGTSNPGIAALARPIDVPVDAKQAYRLEQFCDHHDVSLIVVGPEDPLAEGLVNALATESRLVFGPVAEGARLEADKAWARDLFRSASVSMAEGRSFTDFDNAREYLESRNTPQVIKAAGLAKGKGVFVPDSQDEALNALNAILVDKAFGDAGRTVIIEEKLAGPEISVFALFDGRSLYILDACQDHKRLLDGDKGPNTGGMGAFGPSTLINEKLMIRIEQDILLPVVEAFKRESIDYRGVLYAGLMLTHAGPRVLEFNVRFGDPECQIIMPRIKTDLVSLLAGTASRKLASVDISWEQGTCCTVVLASEGYPDNPRTGVPITGMDQAQQVPGVTVFQAGTALDKDGQLVTAGGRVLNVTAMGDTLEQARERAYQAVDLIHFQGMVCRRDIASNEPRT